MPNIQIENKIYYIMCGNGDQKVVNPDQQNNFIFNHNINLNVTKEGDEKKKAS